MIKFRNSLLSIIGVLSFSAGISNSQTFHSINHQNSYSNYVWSSNYFKTLSPLSKSATDLEIENSAQSSSSLFKMEKNGLDRFSNPLSFSPPISNSTLSELLVPNIFLSDNMDLLLNSLSNIQSNRQIHEPSLNFSAENDLKFAYSNGLLNLSRELYKTQCLNDKIASASFIACYINRAIQNPSHSTNYSKLELIQGLFFDSNSSKNGTFRTWVSLGNVIFDPSSSLSNSSNSYVPLVGTTFKLNIKQKRFTKKHEVYSYTPSLVHESQEYERPGEN